MWGATESLAAPQLTADNQDYAYVYFNTFLDNLEFRPIEHSGFVSEEGEAQDLFELVLKITDKSSPLASRYARQTFDASCTPPPPSEWQTGDLWTPHPDPAKKSYAWKFVCRKDDLVSFSTGMWAPGIGPGFLPSMLFRLRDTSVRKFRSSAVGFRISRLIPSWHKSILLTFKCVGVSGHPAPLERALIASQKVRAAIVIGDMHRQALALIELAEGQEVSQELAHELWEEIIAPANDKAQTHIRVDRTHVLLFPAGSFLRTGKGSVIRKATEAKFSKEIEEVYKKFGDVWHDAKDRYGSISQTTSITVEVVPNGE